MSEYERFTTGVEDMEWITHQSSKDFLIDFYKMLAANVNCEFAYAEHDENQEFEILADMVLQHLTYLADKDYNKLNGRSDNE